MPITLDDTAKGANANSYASLSAANAYFDTRDGATEWTAAVDDEARKRWLIMATRDLDTIDWDRARVGYPTSATQRLQFPSNGMLLRQYVGAGSAESLIAAGYATTGIFDPDAVPEPLVEACCEQALAHAKADRMSDAAARGVTAVAAGEVSLQFDAALTASRRRISEAAWRIVAPWAVASGDEGGPSMRVVDLVRA